MTCRSAALNPNQQNWDDPKGIRRRAPRNVIAGQLDIGFAEAVLEPHGLPRGQVNRVRAIRHPVEPNLPNICQLLLGIRNLVHDLRRDYLCFFEHLFDLSVVSMARILSCQMAEPEIQRDDAQDVADSPLVTMHS